MCPVCLDLFSFVPMAPLDPSSRLDLSLAALRSTLAERDGWREMALAGLDQLAERHSRILALEAQLSALRAELRASEAA